MSKKKLQEQASPFDSLNEIINTEVANKNQPKSRTKKRKKASTNATMYRDQIQWLDTMVVQARANDGKAIRRADLMRAIIDFAKSVNPNLKGVQSEEEIVSRFSEAVSPAK